ncbi:hypothetical protein GYB59_00510 [bacterium]|nr:hypothetical protein [bacterium]
MPDDKVEIICGACQKRILAPREKAGNRFQCPRCGELLMVPFDDAPLPTKRLPAVAKKPKPQKPILVTGNILETKVSPVRETTLSRPSLHTWSPAKRPVWCIVAGVVLCLLGFANGLFGYPGIALIFFGASVIMVRKIQKPWPYAACAAAGFVMLIFWGSRDTYTVSWARNRAAYTDKINRWTGRIAWREVVSYQTETGAITRNFQEIQSIHSGPMSGHDSPHGAWHYLYVHPSVDSGYQFYWYGDQVSEGEWNLRNK